MTLDIRCILKYFYISALETRFRSNAALIEGITCWVPIALVTGLSSLNWEKWCLISGEVQFCWGQGEGCSEAVFLLSLLHRWWKKVPEKGLTWPSVM